MADYSSPYSSLPTYDPSSGSLNVVIETPKGSRNKYTFSEELGIFTLGSVLTAGAVFPYDFGFIPGTRGGDGDPLDVLMLMDEPAFPGCLVTARLIGAMKAEQTEKDGDEVRNDRLIAVGNESHTYRDLRHVRELGDHLLGEIEHFFVSYNEVKGKEFKPAGRVGPDGAKAIVFEGQARFKQLPIRLGRHRKR